jgi:hypothetical protein
MTKGLHESQLAVQHQPHQQQAGLGPHTSFELRAKHPNFREHLSTIYVSNESFRLPASQSVLNQ